MAEGGESGNIPSSWYIPFRRGSTVPVVADIVITDGRGNVQRDHDIMEEHPEDDEIHRKAEVADESTNEGLQNDLFELIDNGQISERPDTNGYTSMVNEKASGSTSKTRRDVESDIASTQHELDELSPHEGAINKIKMRHQAALRGLFSDDTVGDIQQVSNSVNSLSLYNQPSKCNFQTQETEVSDKLNCNNINRSDQNIKNEHMIKRQENEICLSCNEFEESSSEKNERTKNSIDGEMIGKLPSRPSIVELLSEECIEIGLEEEEDLPVDVLPPDIKHPMGEVIRNVPLCTPHIEEITPWRIFRHFISILSHVGVTITLPILIYIISLDIEQSHSSSTENYGILLITSLSLSFCYILIVVEATFSKEYDYLKQLQRNPDINSYILRIHYTEPTVVFRIYNYHYNTRNNNTGAGKIHRKCISNEAHDKYHYESVQEVAQMSIDYNEKAIIKGCFYRTMSFDGEDTRRDFLKQLENLKSQHRNKDKWMTYAIEYSIPGFEHYMICFTDKTLKKHLIYKPYLYMVASLCFLTWPYRLFIRNKLGIMEFTFHKKFY